MRPDGTRAGEAITPRRVKGPFRHVAEGLFVSPHAVSCSFPRFR